MTFKARLFVNLFDENESDGLIVRKFVKITLQMIIDHKGSTL